MAGYIKRLSATAKNLRDAEIDKKIAGTIHQIADTNTFNVQAAMTNATEWRLQKYTISSIDIDQNAKEIEVQLTYSAAGQHDKTKEFFGDKVAGWAKAIIDDDGKTTYQDVTAEVAAG